MDDRTRRYQPGQEDEPMELNDVLEPYRGSEDGADRFADDGGDYDPYAYGETNDDLAYQDEAYGGDDGDEAAEDAWEPCAHHHGRAEHLQRAAGRFCDFCAGGHAAGAVFVAQGGHSALADPAGGRHPLTRPAHGFPSGAAH